MKGHVSRQRKLLAIVAWGGMALWSWLFAGLFLYVEPAVSSPRPAAVLFVLAPQTEARVKAAEELMAAGFAETLVLSVPTNGSPPPDVCKKKRSYPIICFAPDPVTTQGEARALRKLAEDHKWQSVNALTAKFHITRSRIILQRCFEGDLNMVSYEQHLSAMSWAYRYIYETAAFAKVAFNPGC